MRALLSSVTRPFQPPLIHDYTPTVLIEAVRGDEGFLDLIDNDDDNCPLCRHQRTVCAECEAETLAELEVTK